MMKRYIYRNIEQNGMHDHMTGHRAAGLRLSALAVVLMITWMMILGAARPSFAASSRKVKLSKTKLTMVQFGKKTLKLKNINGSRKDIKWSSSNKKVATVSKNGIVRAKKAGTCKIVARYQKKKYVCRVTVQPLALTPENMILDKDSTVVLILNNADIQATWASSNPSVAAVDQYGTVVTKGYGSCQITASYKGTQAVCKLKISNSQSVSLVLAGSSSMDMWDEKQYAGDNTSDKAFLPCKSTNTAIGGTFVTQWINWVGGAQDKIVKYNPNAVVLYVGSNDLNNGNTGITGEKNAENTITLLKKIRESLPKAVIFYVGISPCWSRKGAWNAIAVSNGKLKQYCESQANMYYIDIASACKTSDGTPRKDLFLSDELHPSVAGYAVWKQVVAGTVKKVMGVE